MKLKGELFEIRYYTEILVNTANWLIKNGKLKPSNCPIEVARGKRNLINREPKHKDSDDFISPKKLSNGLYIETNHNKDNCIYYAKRLLEKFGVPQEFLMIE